jgi:hydrogenase/urease accessory protein HupE
MKVLRLTLSLLVCVPGYAQLGVMAAADSRFSAWGGAVVGGLLGLFFGLAFGRALPPGVADYCFGPEEPADK